ncbi:MAG: SUMF1/EgtB/PvdO family nonheme iron enzyme, partial [Phycisphaeraceae bacterium]|nr:SUMF1/EgtB/PvdO family nonheme iron enzyme [Phycisphaeraceae bacterium]
AGPFFETYGASTDSQITYMNGEFYVRTRDGLNMANHPVVEVSWYGATAFGIYYGYQLPTSEQWEAVADYDGTFTYGCGPSIDPNDANYGDANPLGLTSHPYTSPVGYYPAFGYGLCDMAGNVWEWTSTVSGSFLIVHSGDWGSLGVFSTVTSTSAHTPVYTASGVGFRVYR